MKVKVIHPFTDKNTGKQRKPGSVFECDPARAEELHGFVQPVTGKERKNDD